MCRLAAVLFLSLVGVLVLTLVAGIGLTLVLGLVLLLHVILLIHTSYPPFLITALPQPYHAQLFKIYPWL